MTDPRILGSIQMQTQALESMARSLERIANPPLTLAQRWAGDRTFAEALLDLMEIEGNECAHGYGPAAVCPEPDCAWTPLRPIMADAAKLTNRDIGTGAMDA